MAFLMLDKVLAPELIAGVVESSVRPYALEHRLDLDRVLLDYIKVLLFSLLPSSSHVRYFIYVFLLLAVPPPF